jgi:hypothetical protein
MALYVRALTGEEFRQLDDLQRRESGSEMGRRAKIVLLSARRYGVHEISAAVGLHPINVRKWIHRFNRSGIKGLYPRRSMKDSAGPSFSSPRHSPRTWVYSSTRGRFRDFGHN